jgi:hypothetical protein
MQYHCATMQAEAPGGGLGAVGEVIMAPIDPLEQLWQSILTVVRGLNLRIYTIERPISDERLVSILREEREILRLWVNQDPVTGRPSMSQQLGDAYQAQHDHQAMRYVIDRIKSQIETDTYLYDEAIRLGMFRQAPANKDTPDRQSGKFSHPSPDERRKIVNEYHEAKKGGRPKAKTHGHRRITV